MMHRTTFGTPWRPRRAGCSATGRSMGALLVVALLAGCAGAGTRTAEPAPAPPPAPVDPLVAFAATAAPGDRTAVRLPSGQLASVRMVRSYHAASGRECRELAVTEGPVERSRLVCATPSGTWAEARPLLRGGGVARP